MQLYLMLKIVKAMYIGELICTCLNCLFVFLFEGYYVVYLNRK